MTARGHCCQQGASMKRQSSGGRDVPTEAVQEPADTHSETLDGADSCHMTLAVLDDKNGAMAQMLGLCTDVRSAGDHSRLASSPGICLRQGRCTGKVCSAYVVSIL